MALLIRCYEAKIEESEKAGSRLITSKCLYFQHEARCSEHHKFLSPLLLSPFMALLCTNTTFVMQVLAG